MNNLASKLHVLLYKHRAGKQARSDTDMSENLTPASLSLYSQSQQRSEMFNKAQGIHTIY